MVSAVKIPALKRFKGATADASDKQEFIIDEEATVVVHQGASNTTGNDVLQNEAVTDNATYTEQIVSDSDDIAKGTPAADNVPERGGYMNTGLTEAQYHRLETFFKDQFGENAFDALMDKIPDEMRAKGGVFEGLSKAQSLFAVQQMVAWSNDQHGEFSQEITAMMEYLKDGCKDTLTVEESTAIKKIMDDVNENGTIDGYIFSYPAVGSVTNRGASVVNVQIRIDDPPEIILPNYSFTGEIEISPPENLILVEREAIGRENGETFVERILRDGSTERITVTVEPYGTTHVNITSGNINPGDTLKAQSTPRVSGTRQNTNGNASNRETQNPAGIPMGGPAGGMPPMR